MEAQTIDAELPRTDEEMFKHRDATREFYRKQGVTLCRDYDRFWDYLSEQADGPW